eukprot:GGOE01043224.1.p1 GENE.GGOE01043224.1~~GGOE01043224.1.p1  ORF type:complete len:683 (+),score=137.42 GGOE01043224.1:77-2125(+)
MADVFRTLCAGPVRSFGISNLSAAQKQARHLLTEHLNELLSVKNRSVYLHQLILIVCGYGKEDEDAEMTSSTFSEYIFFKVFTEDLVQFEDKFDFLLLCLSQWVCSIRHEFVNSFLHLVSDMLEPFRDENPLQHVLEVVEATQPQHLEDAEAPVRDKCVYNFVNRVNWPLYRQELARLEAEQEVCERRKRHEGETGFFNWKNENVDCATPYSDRMRGLRLLLIGPPGAGKTTQAFLIAKQFNILNVSVGGLLRRFAEAGVDEVAIGVAESMQHGLLVDDKIVWTLVHQEITSQAALNGFVLDGFPRTMTQVKLLEDHLADEFQVLSAALNFELPDNQVMERVAGRLYHKASGRTYHKSFRPPLKANHDDETDEPLLLRADDRPVVLPIRIEEFYAETKPLLVRFKEQGRLFNFDANASAPEIFRDVRLALQEAYRPPPHLRQMVNVVILGPPGSGKSTQAMALQNKFGIGHLCPKDALREEISRKSPLGQRAAAALCAMRDAGKAQGEALAARGDGISALEDLLQEVVLDFLQSPACAKGVVLDGFPPSLATAEELGQAMEGMGRTIDCCLHLEVDNSLSLQRCHGRLLHPRSGRQYHRELWPPKVEGHDDVTGEELRAYDEEQREAVLCRLTAFAQRAPPVLRHFEDAGRLFNVDASKPAEEVAHDIEVMVHRARHLLTLD